MSWKMRLCRDGDSDLVVQPFENLEDGIDWLRQNEPDMLTDGADRFYINRDGFRQYGTDYYWASLERTP